MCIPNAIQHEIQKRTGNGGMIAAFLVNTMQGETPGVKVCHRMEATKHLIKYGFPDTDCETTSDRLSRAGGNPERQGEDETPVQSPLSPGERARACPELAEGVRGKRDCKANHPPRHPQLPDSTPHPPRNRRRSHPRRVSHSHHDRQGQAIHPQEVPHQARRPYGSRKRTAAPGLRRPRLTPQEVRAAAPTKKTPTTPCTQT